MELDKISSSSLSGSWTSFFSFGVNILQVSAFALSNSSVLKSINGPNWILLSANTSIFTTATKCNTTGELLSKASRHQDFNVLLLATTRRLTKLQVLPYYTRYLAQPKYVTSGFAIPVAIYLNMEL